MSQYTSFNADIVEGKNKRTGFLISAIIHALILLLILVRILEFPVEPPAEYAIELLGPKPQIIEPVDNPPGGGNSAGPEDTEPAAGGSPGSEAPPSPTPEEAVKVEEKLEPVKPTPIPVQSSPKPVLSTPTPEVVKVEAPKPSENTSTKPTTSVPSPVPTVIPSKPSTGGASGTSGRANSGDDDAPGSGGTGTGSGSGNGSGGAAAGNGTGGGGGTGNGTGGGSGDGVGVDFDAIGVLKRKVIWRPDLKDLARESAQSVVFNMCINRDGAVTYIKYNSKASKTKEVKFIREATLKMQQYKFQVDTKAPRKECGTFTFNALGIIQKLN